MSFHFDHWEIDVSAVSFSKINSIRTINQKHVTFNEATDLILIPTRKELIDAGIDIWYKIEEHSFPSMNINSTSKHKCEDDNFYSVRNMKYNYDISLNDIDMDSEKDSDKQQKNYLNALPNNYEDLVLFSSESSLAIVVTEPVQPFRISYVNNAWEDLCKFTKEEVIGQTLGIIQGEGTSRSELDRLNKAVSAELPFEGNLINYTKLEKPFHNHLSMKPIRNGDGKLTHYAAILKRV